MKIVKIEYTDIGTFFNYLYVDFIISMVDLKGVCKFAKLFYLCILCILYRSLVCTGIENIF